MRSGECWNGAVTNKKVRKGYQLIFHAAVWSIWRVRNDRIFNNVICGVAELVEAIKVLLWRCMLSRLNVPASLFTNGVRVLASVLGVNGTVSVQRRLRLGYVVFCCMRFCCSVVLLFGIC